MSAIQKLFFIKIPVAIFFMMMFLSCKVEPEPIQYGKDGCHTCKMTLMDSKFGAEVVTHKGKIYKFDDINCMLTFYHDGEVTHEDIAHKLVVDFSNPGKLINAGDAFYLKSPEIKSPMASQIAAFEKETAMEEVQKKWNGIYMVWGELQAQFK